MNYSIDGNQVCCTGPGFINLQESHAGFGDSLKEAFINYWDTQTTPPELPDLKDWERPWVNETKFWQLFAD